MNIEDRVNKMSIDLEKFVEKASIWQSLFDECPFAIAVFSSDMKFYLTNHAFTELTGFTPEEINNNKIQMVLPNDVKKIHKRYEDEYAIKPVKKVNRHGLTPYILTKDNRSIPVDIDLSYIIYNSRIYYVSFIRRIT
jgi:PAS domain S-box-containing protein